MQVIKYSYSYQLAHYDHENILLAVQLPCIVSAMGLPWGGKNCILKTVHGTCLVFTDQMEHL